MQVDKEKLKDGYKADEGKARHDLVPAICLEELAKHYTAGANKYEDNNWMKGMRWGQVYAALCRHLFAFWAGEDYDEETGNLHMVAVMWGATTLLYYQKYPERFKDKDDRPWKGTPQGIYREGQIVMSGELTHASIIDKLDWGDNPAAKSMAEARMGVPFENQSGPMSHHYGKTEEDNILELNLPKNTMCPYGCGEDVPEGYFHQHRMVCIEKAEYEKRDDERTVNFGVSGRRRGKTVDTICEEVDRRVKKEYEEREEYIKALLQKYGMSGGQIESMMKELEGRDRRINEQKRSDR